MKQPKQTFSDPCAEYARRVVSGKLVAGPLVRLACQRHLDDLEHAEERGLEYDKAAADRVFRYFRTVLRLPDGEHAGKAFEPSAHQLFVLGSLFGWKEKSTGFRRFRVAYVEEGKGNGKSPLAAGIGLFMTTSDGEPGAEVYAAAVTREQAGIMFQDAVKMRERSPILARQLTASGVNPIYNLLHASTSSFFRPIASEGRGLDGKRVHCAIIDEVHEHPTEVVVEKMRAGTKGRRQGLIFMITNSGYDKQSVCFHWHEFGARALRGEIPERSDYDHCFFYICSLDEGDDWKSESVWLKANPNLNVSISERYLREQVREAIAMPSKQGIVRRLNFCEWTESFSPWITAAALKDTFAPLRLEDYEGERCFGGLDLSMARDLTAFALCFPKPERRFDIFVFYWTPGDSLHDRAYSDRMPYPLWVEQGHLIATPGKVVDYAWAARSIADCLSRFDVESIAFDEYRIAMLEKELNDIGVVAPLAIHPQGYRRSQTSRLWMPESVSQLEGGINEGRVRFQTNPLTASCIANVALEADAQGNRKFTKVKSTGRIDGIVASAMSIGAATQSAPLAVSVYDVAAQRSARGMAADVGANDPSATASARA